MTTVPPPPAERPRPDVILARARLDPTGRTDIVRGLAALVREFDGEPGEIVLERGRYRVWSELTPEEAEATRCVRLTFKPGAELVVDGTVFRHLGTIDAGPEHHFNLVNGGRVEFFPAAGSTWSQGGAFIPHVLPEWFGAVGDGLRDRDVDGFDGAWLAMRGLPQTPHSAPSWCRSQIKMRPGACYVFTRLFRYEASIGCTLTGGGYQNTQIKYRGGRERYRIMAYPAPDTVQLSAEVPDAVGRWLVVAGSAPGHRGIKREITAALGDRTYRLDRRHWLTAVDQDAYVCEIAVIDCSGNFDTIGEGFSIAVEAGSHVMSGFYYHRDARRTARGSSRGGFKDVQITGYRAFGEAAWALGSFHPGQSAWQEDLCSLWNCHAYGGWDTHAASNQQPLDNDVWDLNGYRVGSGAFANPLNFTFDACVSVGFRHGVAQLATNVTWTGGTIQRNHADVYLVNGGQHTARYVGFRSESSHHFVLGWSGQSVAFNIRLEDIEWSGANARRNEASGEYDVIVLPWAGTATIDGVRLHNMPGTAEAPYTAIGHDSDGNGWVESDALELVPNEWPGDNLTLRDPGSYLWSGMMYEVLRNTERRVTIRGGWRTGSFGETGFDWPGLAPPDGRRTLKLTRTAKIRHTWGRTSVSIARLITPHIRREQVLRGSTSTVWDIRHMEPHDTSPVPQAFGRPSAMHTGITVTGYHEHEPVSRWRWDEDLAWTTLGAGRILVDAPYTVPLGGGPLPRRPDRYAQVPFPPRDAELTFELTQDAIGQHAVSFETTKPIVWDRGDIPSPAWPAHRTRIYRFRYDGQRYLGRFETYG